MQFRLMDIFISILIIKMHIQLRVYKSLDTFLLKGLNFVLEK